MTEPTQAQVELACDVAIAVLCGDALQASRLIAEHDAAHAERLNEQHEIELARLHRERVQHDAELARTHEEKVQYVIRLSERTILQMLKESEQDLNRLLRTEPIPLREFIAETRILNASKEKDAAACVSNTVAKTLSGSDSIQTR